MHTATPPPPPILDGTDQAPSFWRRRGVRTAWIVLGSFFTIASVTWVAVETVARLAHEVTTEELSWADSGITTVEIRNSAGDTAVVGTDTDTIELTSRISRGLFDTDHDARVEGDRLVLTTDCPEVINHFCEVDQRLVVPRGVEVEIVSYRGDTEVADVDGHVRIFNEDGRVDLARLGGRLDLDLRHGTAEGTQLRSADVTTTAEYGRVRLAFAEAPDLVTVDAQFGDVEILVPDDDTTYAVVSSTQFGDTDNQLRTDPQSPARIVVTTEFGRVRLGYTS
jgi:Putative adhesin